MQYYHRPGISRVPPFHSLALDDQAGLPPRNTSMAVQLHPRRWKFNVCFSSRHTARLPVSRFTTTTITAMMRSR